MHKRTQLGFQSALLVSTGVIVIAFILAILCWCIKFNELAVLLMSLSVVGLTSRLWGSFALESVSLTANNDASVISAGQNFTTHYTITNNKALPLIWLDLCLDVPANHCLSPDDNFKEISFEEREAEYLKRSKALSRRFAFIGGYSTLEWDSVWTGQKRGIYLPDQPIFRSGDGFGLAQITDTVSDYESKCYVVWPRLIPVKTEGFIKNVFSGNTGKQGYLEDLSVLRNERRYMPGDSWKKIDWRNAARTDELMVKEFETVMPQSFLFVLDTSSFSDRENAISILASVIFELNRKGFCCGLSLPASGTKAQFTVAPAENSFEAAMYALSETDAENAAEEFDTENIYAAANCGHKIWLVTDSPDKIAIAQIREHLKEYSVYILSETAVSSMKFEEVKQ